MAGKYFFSLSSIKPQDKFDAGSQTFVTSNEVPGFVNISFSTLKLNTRGSLEPIWHPNANKIGYCVSGKTLVSLRSPAANDLFTVEIGDVFFIPQGYIHHIENIGNDESTINFAFSNPQPETMFLSKAINSLSPYVFNTTFNENNSFFEGLKKSKENQPIQKLSPLKKNINSISNRYKFNVNDSSKVLTTKGGYLQLATKPNLPVLNELGILRFGLSQKGIVEPHWHTNAGELVYIVKGQTRISVLPPDGNLEVMEVNGGEGAFAPASHFHNIENIGTDEVEVIAYFSHADPDYIGIGEVAGSYDNELLSSVFNVAPNYFDKFKKPSGPLVILPI